MVGASRRTWRRCALLLAILLLGAITPGISYAQTEEQTEPQGQSSEGIIPEGARRVLLFFEVAEGAQYGESEVVLLRESLFASLAEYREELAVVQWTGARKPGDDGERTVLALDYGCDLWLSVTVSGSFESPAYQATAFDLVTRKYPLELTVEPDQRLRTRDLAGRFWSDIGTELVANLERPEFGTEITFVGVPMTRITGVGDRRIVLDQDGRAVSRLPNPNVYTYRATRLGYETVSGVLIVGDDAETVELHQVPAPRHVVDLGLSTLSYPSVSYGYHLLPDYLFAKVGLTTYVAGIYLLGETEERNLLVSEPMTEFYLQLGAYFIASDKPIRGYAGGLAGIRMVHSPFLVGLDPLAKYFAGTLLGMEFEPFESVLGFLEWTPVFLFSDAPALLASGFPAGYHPMGLMNWVQGILDPIRYRVGVRFKW